MIRVRDRAKIFVNAGIARALNVAGLVDKLKRSNGLVILMFHKVNNNPDPLKISILPEVFSALLRDLQHEERIVPLNEESLACRDDVGGLRFAITFDDGYKDNYEVAYPILREWHADATIYVSTNFIYGRNSFWYEKVIHAIQNTTMDRLDLANPKLEVMSLRDGVEKNRVIHELNTKLKQYTSLERNAIADTILHATNTHETFRGSEMLSWDDVRDLDRGGIEIGSHTVNHPILSRESSEVIRDEVWQSKEVIEAETGHKIVSFAYPNGGADDYNPTVLREVEAAGYNTACTTIEGINKGQTSRYELLRVNVYTEMCTDKDGNYRSDLFWFSLLKSYVRR